MNRVMNRAARGALEGVDAARAGDRGRALGRRGHAGLRRAARGRHAGGAGGQQGRPDQGQDRAAAVPGRRSPKAASSPRVHPISALKRKGLERWCATCWRCCRKQPPLYGEDEITDRSQRFLAGELVREQLMRQLGDGTAVCHHGGDRAFAEDGAMLRIGAVIWVEREGQKAIVIGKGGARLQARSAARRGCDGAPVRQQGVPGDLGARARGLVRRRGGAEGVRLHE